MIESFDRGVGLRWEYAYLGAVVDRVILERSGRMSEQGFLPPDSERAVLLGVHVRTLFRWRVNGLKEAAADEAACGLGLHPFEVWPSWLVVYGVGGVALHDRLSRRRKRAA